MKYKFTFEICMNLTCSYSNGKKFDTCLVKERVCVCV